MSIKKNIKSTINALAEMKMIISVYNGWNKRYRKVYNNPDFKLSSLTPNEKKEYKEYWGKVSPYLSFKTVEISKSLSGHFDKRIVPEEFYPIYIERVLNKDKRSSFLENKSIYNKWFKGNMFPKDFFHKTNGKYYNHNFEPISDINKFIDSLIGSFNFPLVIKPSKDSYGGSGVHFVENVDDIKRIIGNYPDLVVQEKIKQSPLINEVVKDSINTVRVCLYRDDDNNINVLNTSLRMGKNGSLDNETAGGIVCFINSNGEFNEYAVDKYATKYYAHPNSNYVFKGKKMPYYDRLISVSKEVADQLLGVQIISLDMCLDQSNSWRCIEANLFGQTIRFAQYAGQPFFGEYTDEIINKITR